MKKNKIKPKVPLLIKDEKGHISSVSQYEKDTVIYDLEANTAYAEGVGLTAIGGLLDVYHVLYKEQFSKHPVLDTVTGVLSISITAFGIFRLCDSIHVARKVTQRYKRLRDKLNDCSTLRQASPDVEYTMSSENDVTFVTLNTRVPV